MDMRRFGYLGLAIFVVALLLAGCTVTTAQPQAIPPAATATAPAPTPTVATASLAFSALEPYWSKWAERKIQGTTEVYCQRTDKGVTSGIHVEPGQSFAFDAYGYFIPPTVDGGLITFRTDDCTYTWVNGIQVQASNFLTLQVSTDRGLIYKGGSGTVVLKSGDRLTFGSPPGTK